MQEGLDRQLSLLCTISEGSLSLQEILDLAYELFDNPIHVTDMSRNVLVYSSSGQISQERWLRDVVQGEGIVETPQQVQEVRRIHNESLRSKLPLYVDDDTVPFPRLIKTLLNASDQPVGIVILSGINHPLSPTDGQLLELLSTYIVRQAEKERFILQPNDRQAENFVIKLLEGTVNSETQVAHWLHHLDWHPKAFRYALVLTHDGTGQEPEAYERVIAALKELPHSRAVIYDGSIVLILSRETPVGRWEEDEQTLLHKVLEWNMAVGISQEILQLCQVREAYLEAKTALRIGTELGQKGPVYDYAHYSLYHLLETLPKGVDIRRFCHDKVLRLESADKSADKELLTTLYWYLISGKSLAKTADVLFIHRNTVRYRVGRCKEIMQTEFDSGEELFDFLLSLRLLQKIQHTEI